MADNSTFITGAAEGAFTDALNGVPAWATQDTALEIEKLISKLLDIQTTALSEFIKSAKTGPNGLSSTEAKELNDVIGDLAKNLKASNDQAEKDLALKKKLEKSDKEELTRKEKRKIKDDALDKVLAGVAGAGSKVLESQKQYYTTSNDLFKSGVNLLDGQDKITSSMESLNGIVVLSGMRLQTFQKAVEKYSTSVNAVGVTKFARSISESSKKLIELGYSSEQQADLIGSLIDSESEYSDVRRKSSSQIAADAIKVGAQLTKLSLATGQSTTALLESVKALSKNTDSTVVSAMYGEEAAKRLNIAASGFQDVDIQTMIQRLGAAITPEITQTFQSLAKAGAAPIAQEFTRISQSARDGIISAEDAQRRYTDVARQVSSSTLANLSLYADAGVEGAKETLTAIAKLRAAGNKTSEATKGQTDAAIKSQSSISAFDTAIEHSASLVQRAFPLLETQVDKLTWGLIQLNSAADALIGTMSAELRSWIGVGIELAGVIATIILARKTISNFGTAMSTMPGILGRAGSVIENTFGSIGKVGSALGVLTAGLGVAAAGAFAAYEVFKAGSAIKDLYDIKHREGVKKSSYANDRIKNMSSEERARFDAMDPGHVKTTQISIPKDPTASTINSPSAVPADPSKVDNNSVTTADSSSPVSNGADRVPPTQTGDINSTLNYQSSLLAQILESTKNMVSVNKDILKYSRSST